VLNLAKRFSTFCWLDNQQYSFQPHQHECIVAIGEKRSIQSNTENKLGAVDKFLAEKNSWVFGHLSYELKNEIHGLQSCLPDRIGFPDYFFFEPEWLVRINGDEIIIEGNDPDQLYDLMKDDLIQKSHNQSINLGQRINEEEYITIIEKLQQHLLRGDSYEINFCQEFFDEHAEIDPVHLYKKLSELSPSPFSALYRIGERWLICASPERFLMKKDNTLFSQPMKGTAARNEDIAIDKNNRDALLKSEKEKSENVMVVDLVRNDLSRVCKKGSVEVEELFGIYSFPQVHQMVSTVKGIINPGTKFSEIIKACFPMGSMTGAPKKRVMELIEQYEQTRRGIFSGAVGYFSPGHEDGCPDFDFNVVIRSILYDAGSGYLSFLTGSGITYYSDARKEWEECLLKASALKKALEN
jgi:para-aminobenzoate synthetase component 1